MNTPDRRSAEAKESNSVSPTGQPRPASRGPMGISGIVKARELIKDILDQVTLHDCPPMNEAIALQKQNLDRKSSKSIKSNATSRRERKASGSNSNSNSSQSITNSSMTSTSASNSQVSYHSSGVPRPFSRQRHVLPTVWSPTISVPSTPSKDPSHAQSDPGPSLQHLDSTRLAGGAATAEPSPTPADVGDQHHFFHTLHSPSFANSHIVSSFSQSTDNEENPHLQVLQKETTLTPLTPLTPLPPPLDHKEAIVIPMVESPPSQVDIHNKNFTSPTKQLPPPPPMNHMRPATTGHGAEVIMGNLSLAALCVRTLESISEDFDVQIPNPLITARQKDVANEDWKESDETKEDSTTSWQREVEMAPTFVSSEVNNGLSSGNNNNSNSNSNSNSSRTRNERKENDYENNLHDSGALKRREFLSSMDEDEILFPEAQDDDDSDILGSASSKDGLYNIGQHRASDDGMFLSAVQEEDDNDDNDKEGTSKDAEDNNNTGLVFSPAMKAAQEANSGLMEQHPNLPSQYQSSSISPESKLTLSPENSQPLPRMQMFGSEYARHLSSQSPFSPMIPKMKQSRGKKQRKSTSNSSTAAASFMGEMSISPTSTGMSVATIQTGRSPNVVDGFQRNTNTDQNDVSTKINHPTHVLEDAPEEVLSAAITDIVVTHGDEMPPKGYYRISHTGNCTQVDTLKQMSTTGKSVLGRKKLSSVHLNVKKEPKWEKAVQRPCVTALTVIFPDRNEFVPPGFCVVRKHVASASAVDKGGNSKSKSDNKDNDKSSEAPSEPANLNFGTTGERVYLCYRRSREGNPITGIIPLQPSSNESIPEGYTVLERSPRNFVADINSKAGAPVFLALRQRLANLETLRPLPLVLSVHRTQSRRKPSPKSKSRRKKTKRLQSYYCTGGTVVHAEVGRFHVMDRSTHPLISPSSVSNRLTLIEASRIKRSASNINESTQLTTDTPSIVTDYQSENDHVVQESPISEQHQSDNGSINSDGLYTKELIVNGIMNLVNNISSSTKDEVGGNKSLASGLMSEDNLSYDELDEINSHASGSVQSNIFVSKDDSNLQACFDAMDFIPLIEIPARGVLSKEQEEAMKTLLEARIAIITPILTACYSQHGCSSLLAVEGLSKLINGTDFFLQDVAGNDDPFVSHRLTLLDIAVQVVCDVASGTSRETNFLPCVEFVSEAVYYAQGNLSARSIGYVIRFYLFVFYFGASVPTSSCWPTNKTSGISRKSGLDEANDIMLLSEAELDRKKKRRLRGYVPGGAPQAAALSLRELLTIFLGKFRKMSSVAKRMKSKTVSNANDIEGYMKEFVTSIVDGATHQVDVANFTQLALHQIHRSGGSELFWHDMLTSCGKGLFSSDPDSTKPVKDFFIISFAMMTSLVKVASGKVRKLTNSISPVPRDVASKLLSIELIHHFLREWGRSLKYLEIRLNKAQKKSKGTKMIQIDDVQSICTIAYNIRRLVVPCLLSNTKAGIEDIKVFRRMMNVVTAIWCDSNIRRHMKIEIGVLIEHFILKFLRLGPQVLPPRRLSNTSSSILNELPVALLPQQVFIVKEIKTWFQSEPRDILELFLNFDQVDAQTSQKKFHLLPSTHWKITQQLCGSICTLAEQCTDIVSEQIRLTRIDLAGVESQSVNSHQSIQPHSEEDLREMTNVREGARYLQEKCFDTIGQITRSLMLCAAASSGANYDLLSKLREKQKRDEQMRLQASNMTENKGNAQVETKSESSAESDGNMTIKSVSTIGTIVGGILNKKKDGKIVDIIEVPESPRVNRLIAPPSADNDGDIVEYWQTSIAAERRKNANNNTITNESNTVKKKPPRTKKLGTRGQSTATPPRTLQLNSASPQARSPKVFDDVSVLSMNEESTRGDPHFTRKMEETLQVAFEIMQNKSLKKAFDYLIACNFLSPSPKEIASFLRLYQSKIDTATLGEFLGEGGKDGDETEHYNLIRFNYVSAISFVGMNVEQGLRHFLTNCGFRLPGEAQKIDRIMTTFSQCYWEDNAGDHGKCPFQDEDTVFLISFAIIMLNTDLHKTSMFAAPAGQPSSKSKQRKKMTKAEFLNNLRGVNNSEDLSKDYLSAIYDSIAANPIAIYRTNENTSFQEGMSGKKTIKFTSNEYGHIIQGNTDLAGMLKHLNKNVKICQELLRGLASHEHPYLTLRNRKNVKKSRKNMVPEDLVRSAFCSTWHHFHGTINSALDSAHLDPKGLENCLDVLMYSLCATICLDQTVERNAFASQLVRVKYFRENRGIEEDEAKPLPKKKSRTRDHLDYKQDSWYLRIEKAAESYHENSKVAALDEVDTMFKKLHASLKVDSTLKKEMVKVARRIMNGQILLNDPTRYFLREGELAKRCNRTGRNVKYTFFLFSDVLIYANQNSGMFKIHGELPLHLMKIMNLSSGNNEKKSKHSRSFHLIHPRKSFVVFASSPEEKRTWLTTINTAISREVKRKARIEGARQASAAFDR